MSPVSIAVLALGMSVDALLAAMGRGAGATRPRLADAMKAGFVFGIVEMITPLIGWAAGMAASQYVAAVDHWIAFTLLGLVGGHMVLNGLRRAPDEAPSPAGSGWTLVATAVGTSIDAMAVGVSLAFLDVNIIVIALAIGLATFCMSTGGMLAGRLIGRRFGSWAEIVGGIGLWGLGTAILIEHLSA